MVLWVASLRLEDRGASFFRGFPPRGNDPALDRSCLLALPGRDDRLRLLLKSCRDVVELLDRPGEVYQLTMLSPVEEVSKNKGDRLVSTRWGDLCIRERERLCCLELSLDIRSVVLWNGTFSEFELIDVALRGILGVLLADTPNISERADSFLGMGGGVAIETKDLSGSSAGFLFIGTRRGLLPELLRGLSSEPRL